MKNIIKRTAAALFAGVMLMSASVTAFGDTDAAAGERSDILLPSGKTLGELETVISDHNAEHSSSDLDDAQFASVLLGVFKGDEVLYTNYLGYSDYENDIPADEDSAYEWGSVSKTLIWVSAMQLWEQGKLDLNKDIREYLPEGFFHKLSFDDPITMLNLMDHSAGWCETTKDIWYKDGETIPPLGEELQRIEPAQVNRPGEVVAYSNYGAAVAGYIVERISGMEYSEYVRRNIFDKLGMEHTSIAPDHSDNRWVYEQRRKMKSYNIGVMNNICNGNALEYVGAYPAGAAAGTLTDLMTYAQALVNDDAPLFDDPATQKELFTAIDFYGDSDVPANAHGFIAIEYNVRVWMHSGATVFGQADMQFDPESKVGFVLMQNQGVSGASEYQSLVPLWVFGELEPDKYSSTVSTAKLTGRHYLMARSQYRGMLSFMPVLGAVSFDGDFDVLENGTLQSRGKTQLGNDGGKSEAAAIIGRKQLPDGRDALETQSMDVIYDRYYLPKLLLMTAYFLTAVIGSYVIRLRIKLKKSRRTVGIKGAFTATAASAAWLTSLLTMTASMVIYYKYTGGIPAAAGAVMGVIQMLCGGVCAASAAGAAVSAVTAKENRRPALALNILTIAASLLCGTAIVFYQLYCFWGC